MSYLVKLVHDKIVGHGLDKGTTIVVAPISRLLCDMERFRDDTQQEMATRGMGVCYTKASDGQPLKTVTEPHRRGILSRYYDPHHKRLTELVQETLSREGWCTLVDCHSFSSVPLPYEPDQSPKRPDICLGTSPYHTPEKLTDLCRDYFTAFGLTVQENTPYAGVLVPQRYYLKESGVRAIMLEINRCLYMDERDGLKLASFARLQEQIAGLLKLMEREL